MLAYWQEINRQDLVKFGVDLEHITNFAGFRIISIYHHTTKHLLLFKFYIPINNKNTKGGI